jgi:hypothetical protein
VSREGTRARSIEEHVACPARHGPITVRGEEISCSRRDCGFTGALADGIAIMRGNARDRTSGAVRRSRIGARNRGS